MENCCNLVDFVPGIFYSQEYLHESKKKLEMNEGIDLVIEETKQKVIDQKSSQLMFRCSNTNQNVCSFRYVFYKKTDVETKEIAYEFSHKHTDHSKQCIINDESYAYARNYSLIDQQKLLIAEIILSRNQIYGIQSPKTILDEVSKVLGCNGPFILKGIKNSMIARSLKKKFDNKIAHVRKMLGLNPLKKSKVLRKKIKKINIARHKLKSQTNEMQQNQIFDDISESESQESQEQFVVCRNKRKLKQSKISTGSKSIVEKEFIREESFTAEGSGNQARSSKFQNPVRRSQRLNKQISH